MIQNVKNVDRNKKRTKMVELRTFVEAKLLSRSEKNLENMIKTEDEEFFEMVTLQQLVFLNNFL